MEPKRRRRQRPKLRKFIKGVLLTTFSLQLVAVTAVHMLDRLRKARVPGGVTGFPALHPSDTAVSEDVVRTYTEGQSLYHDMLTAIRSAKELIFFETYVWRADLSGQEFKTALIEAAERGVEVYVIYDGFGSFLQSPRFKMFPRIPTLHVHKLPEIRFGLLTLNARRTGRTHRKLLVVDDQVGFIGGFNIGDDFGTEWRDTHLRVIGPSVTELSDGFVTFWNFLRRRHEPELEDRYASPWMAEITTAFNLPSRLLFPIRGLYLEAFDRAQDHIYLTTPYFIPDREFTAGLLAAVHRGVQVRILIPEYSNHILADWVSRPYLGPLLRGGVEIWLYQHAMIHSKTMTVDGIWATVGTANIDRLSMMGNAEVNMQIVSPEFAQRMEEAFNNDLTTARQLTLAEWEQRSWLTKFTEVLLGPFNPVV